MTVLPLSRRLVAVVAASGLALTGLVIAGSASAADGCLAWTDPKGDSIATFQGGSDPSGTFTDANLDIVGSRVVTTGDSLVASIVSDGLSDSASDLGDEFGLDFTVAGVSMTLFTDRDPAGGEALYGSAGVLNNDDANAPIGAAESTYDVAKKTVTITVKVTEVAAAAGKPVTGQVASALRTYTTDQVATVPVIHYDDSASPLTVVVGASCSGDAVAPTGSGTPAPSGSASPTPTPTPAPSGSVLLDQPRKKCLQFPDAAGDAATNPVSGQATDTSKDLDLTGVVYRTSPDALQAYVSETALGTKPDSLGGNFYDTHSFSTGFTVGGKAIVLTAGATGPATATVGGVASTALHATAAFDTKHSNIVFSVPLANLATVTAQPVKGAAVTALTASSLASSSSGAPGGTGDSAAPTTTVQKTYVVGDNTCFLPPAGVLTIDGDSGVYSDVTTIFANLVDVDGAAVEGAKVTLTLTGMAARSAITDSDGDATFEFPVTVKAGANTVGVSFAGNADVGAAKASAPYKVALESTVLKSVGSKGAVTATLTDNDRTPLAKRVVVFTVGSKVTKVATNAKGQAVLKNLARGTTVKVSFAAVSGYYSAAKTVSAKAL